MKKDHTTGAIHTKNALFPSFGVPMDLICDTTNLSSKSRKRLKENDAASGRCGGFREVR
jgi:hypothetical protein